MLQRLDVSVPGVTVNASGSPGSRSTVRIRGISSFQNNDPLYIVDGVPVQDSYINWLNPDDITSIQVLKDASAASIYGSRASNGVIVIETTKKGVAGPPKATLRVRSGVASPVKGYDDFLITNSLDYFKVVKAAYTNAGLPIPTNIYGDPNNPSVPKYIYADNCAPVRRLNSFGQITGANASAYSYPNALIMPGSAGTDWWKPVFGTAPLADYNLDVSGGGDDNAYSVSLQLLRPERHGDLQRLQTRQRPSEHRVHARQVELRRERRAVDSRITSASSQDDDQGEGGIIGKNILMQPVIPVYDIAGNFAGRKATRLGNNTNPLKIAYDNRDNVGRNNRIFGNVFAGFAARPRSEPAERPRLQRRPEPLLRLHGTTPELAEANFSNALNENQNTFLDWTWSNTAEVRPKFFDSTASRSSSARKPTRPGITSSAVASETC